MPGTPAADCNFILQNFGQGNWSQLYGIIDVQGESFVVRSRGWVRNHLESLKRCSRRLRTGVPLIIPLDEIVSPEGRPDALQTSGLARLWQSVK